MSQSPLDAFSVLLVEDSDADAELFRRAFFSVELTYFFRARDIASAKSVLARTRPDCVVLALGLPDSKGLSGLQHLRAFDEKTPIVIVTGRRNQRMAEAAIRGGAREYVIKGAFDGEALGHALLDAVRRQLKPPGRYAAAAQR